MAVCGLRVELRLGASDITSLTPQAPAHMQGRAAVRLWSSAPLPKNINVSFSKQVFVESRPSAGSQRDANSVAKRACSWYAAPVPAAIDRYLLPAGCSAANPPTAAAAVDRWDRQTDVAYTRP